MGVQQGNVEERNHGFDGGGGDEIERQHEDGPKPEDEEGAGRRLKHRHAEKRKHPFHFAPRVDEKEINAQTRDGAGRANEGQAGVGVEVPVRGLGGPTAE